MVILVTGAPAWPADEIRIGISTSITGNFSVEARYYVNEARMFEKEINQAGGINGKNLRIVIVDNQSTNPGALNSLNKAVDQDNVLALIGPVKSTQILAMSDAVKAYGIPMMVGGTNATITRQGNPWLFRCRVSDAIVAPTLIKYVKDEMKLTRVGMIHSSDAFGTGGGDLLEEHAKASGLTVVARERFNLQDRDFTAQLLALKTAGAEVMIPYSAGHEELARIIMQYRQLGTPFQYLGPPATSTKTLLDLAKESVEGLIGFADAVPNMNEANRRFINAYRKEFNADPDMQASWEYDALNILINAIRKAGEDRAKIREAILATQGYEGVYGMYNFTPDGEGLHGGPLAIIKNGKPTLVKMVYLNQ